MGNRRVFIGWSGEENREIACRISNELSSANYFPIIGGEWKASLTVSQEIIQQMKACDFAIILIEKETRKNEKGEIVSIGFNPNVMMEIGAVNACAAIVTDKKEIIERRILSGTFNGNESPFFDFLGG
jgi:hypothetical protein